VEINTGINKRDDTTKKSRFKAANMNNWIIPERLKAANKGLIDFVAGHYIQ
jgi:hypothetical protein